MNDGSYILALGTVLFTLFVVLVERKVLAYAMRRVGPILMGRNGAFQIAFDLVKLVTKETFLIPRPTTSLAPMFLALLYCCQLMFSQTFIWGPSMFIFDNLDSMILYHLILVLFGNIFFYRSRAPLSISVCNYRHSSIISPSYLFRYFYHDCLFSPRL